jgi:TRAP-type C4-dicarboxylate transport system permease small subunit
MTIAMGLVASAHRRTETQERDVINNLAGRLIRKLLNWISGVGFLGGLIVFFIGCLVLGGMEVFTPAENQGIALFFTGLVIIAVFAKALRSTKRKTRKWFGFGRPVGSGLREIEKSEFDQFLQHFNDGNNS